MPETDRAAMFGINNIDALVDAGATLVLPVVGEALVLRRGGRAILDDVDVRIAAGGTTVLMGPNGAGKSILLRVLAALVTPDSGVVRWAGAPPIRALRPRLGFVFQKPVLLRRSAIANIRHALHAAGCSRARSSARARDALEFAGLLHLQDSPARLLSGGEQQRLAIARALALEPEVLFLDEPTANLDPAATAQIETMVRHLSSRTKKVVLVTHDIGQARRLASHVAFMHHGKIVEAGDASPFFNSPATRSAAAFLGGEIVL
ncbi:MAG: tungstate transport system ATP-binding protein [Gammaproteobacteria bacterium]|jgi:tungstate transport system ATP-binding protein